MSTKQRRILDETFESMFGSRPGRRPSRKPLAEATIGDYRRADPKNSPRPFIQVHKAAQAYFSSLAGAMNKLHSEEVALVHALYGLQQAIKKAGFDPAEVAPDSMAMFKLIQDLANEATGVSHFEVLKAIRKYVKGNELTTGASPVRM